MCSDTVVRVDNLGKCYQIYKKPHERLLQSLFRGKKPSIEISGLCAVFLFILVEAKQLEL